MKSEKKKPKRMKKSKREKFERQDKVNPLTSVAEFLVNIDSVCDYREEETRIIMRNRRIKGRPIR